MSECKECGGEFEYLPCACGASAVPDRESRRGAGTRFDEYVLEIARAIAASEPPARRSRNETLSNTWDMRRMRERVAAIEAEAAA